MSKNIFIIVNLKQSPAWQRLLLMLSTRCATGVFLSIYIKLARLVVIPFYSEISFSFAVMLPGHFALVAFYDSHGMERGGDKCLLIRRHTDKNMINDKNSYIQLQYLISQLSWVI